MRTQFRFYPSVAIASINRILVMPEILECGVSSGRHLYIMLHHPPNRQRPLDCHASARKPRLEAKWV